MITPAFLTLPERSTKPRTVGLTHVLDKGLTVESARSALAAAAPHIDVWKFGWGTAYLDVGLPEKLELLRAHGVRSCLGGTLLEISWAQGKAQDCLDWAAAVGFDSVEVSRGVAPMSLDDKHDLMRRRRTEIRRVVRGGEQGSRHRSSPPSSGPARWRRTSPPAPAGSSPKVEKAAPSGSTGRTGRSGRTWSTAAVRGGGVDKIMFEAPRKDQQAWLIRAFGADVNLANIPAEEVLALETLRLGLRADTCDLSRLWQPA